MASPEPSAVNAESSAAAGPEREGAVGEPPINRRAAVNPYAGAGREASSARLRAEADKSERHDEATRRRPAVSRRRPDRSQELTASQVSRPSHQNSQTVERRGRGVANRGVDPPGRRGEDPPLRAVPSHLKVSPWRLKSGKFCEQKSFENFYCRSPLHQLDDNTVMLIQF